jgi:hypothetical protein
MVIRPEFDVASGARFLAETTKPDALEEAIAHLRHSLFEEEDRVAADAANLLLLAFELATRPSFVAA